MIILQDCKDVEGEVQPIDKGTPYIIVANDHRWGTAIFCCGGEKFAESGTLAMALVDVVASYFVFDVVHTPVFILFSSLFFLEC